MASAATATTSLAPLVPIYCPKLSAAAAPRGKGKGKGKKRAALVSVSGNNVSGRAPRSKAAKAAGRFGVGRCGLEQRGGGGKQQQQLRSSFEAPPQGGRERRCLEGGGATGAHDSGAGA